MVCCGQQPRGKASDDELDGSAFKPGLSQFPFVGYGQPDALRTCCVVQACQLRGRRARMWLEDQSGIPGLRTPGDHFRVQVDLLTSLMSSPAARYWPTIIVTGSLERATAFSAIMILATARKLSSGMMTVGTRRSLTSNGVTARNKIEMEQPLDPAGDYFRQRAPRRPVAHQTIGVDVDPGVAEDAADCLCRIDMDALDDQVQIIGTQIPELPEMALPQW
jgi:hypothetical protein